MSDPERVERLVAAAALAAAAGAEECDEAEGEDDHGEGAVAHRAHDYGAEDRSDRPRAAPPTFGSQISATGGEPTHQPSLGSRSVCKCVGEPPEGGVTLS